MPGAPVTLQLAAVPERQALENLLRGAAGYMVLARTTATPGASAFVKILVLPTTSRAPAVAAPPPPAPPPPQLQNRPDTDVDLDEPAENPQGPPPGAFPRARVPANAPPNAPPPVPTEDEGPAQNAPAPAPGNPFGVVPGGARPGTINTPPPRNAPNAEQTPR